MASYLYVWSEVSLPLNETGLNHHWCWNKLFVYSKPPRNTHLAHLCWERWIPVTVKEASLLAMNRRLCHGDDGPWLLSSICGFSKLKPWWTFPIFSRSWRGNLDSRWLQRGKIFPKDKILYFFPKDFNNRMVLYFVKSYYKMNFAMMETKTD